MPDKTAAGLVAWCEENLGMPYWYCSQGQRPTLEWLDEKIRQYPKIWRPERIAKAKSEAGRFARCFDCVGLIKGYLWLQPSGGLKYNASQDKNANGMRAVSNPQPISTIPEIPGVLVFMPGHVGVYIGGGRVIECYGFKQVANRPLSAQRWTSWGRCPFIQYPDTPAPEKPVQGPTEDAEGFQVGDRVLVKPETTEYYPGLRMPEWVPGKVYTVDQVRSKGARVIKGGKVCVLLAELVTWCAVENLEKVQE